MRTKNLLVLPREGEMSIALDTPYHLCRRSEGRNSTWQVLIEYRSALPNGEGVFIVSPSINIRLLRSKEHPYFKCLSNQSSTVRYQSSEFCGFRIQ